MRTAGELAAKVWARAHAPVDATGLAAFRILFGALACAMPLRFLASGWVERFYVEPTFHFAYWGFEWVRPLPAPWIHVAFVAMAVAGALIAIGLWYRAAAAAFFLLFTYVELIDVTTYLNHYYLVSLLALLHVVLPLHRAWSIDAWRDPALARDATLPAWVSWLLRFQVAVVYVFAALAKLTPDWLLHAQPLSLWLGARMDTPVVGPLFDRIEVAYLMSWAGFLYDLTIPFWLSWRRTRAVAFLVLLAFHTSTGVLFEIGMFPWIMTVAAVVFFDPGWARRIGAWVGLGGGGASRAPGASCVPRFRGVRAAGAIALAAWCAVQVLMPLRSHAYGGNVLWDEQGMRWSWRMLCRDKTASVTYRVRARGWHGEREVPPRLFLTLDQEIELGGQPDLILQLAHHIRDVQLARGERDVEVRVDARATLNGRLGARLIDPEVDLARIEDGLARAEWILPPPPGAPARLTRPALARGDAP